MTGRKIMALTRRPGCERSASTTRSGCSDRDGHRHADRHRRVHDHPDAASPRRPRRRTARPRRPARPRRDAEPATTTSSPSATATRRLARRRPPRRARPRPRLTERDANLSPSDRHVDLLAERDDHEYRAPTPSQTATSTETVTGTAPATTRPPLRLRDVRVATATDTPAPTDTPASTPTATNTPSPTGTPATTPTATDDRRRRPAPPRPPRRRPTRRRRPTPPRPPRRRPRHRRRPRRRPTRRPPTDTPAPAATPTEPPPDRHAASRPPTPDRDGRPRDRDPTAACPCTLWTGAPRRARYRPSRTSRPVEVGVKFRADAIGQSPAALLQGGRQHRHPRRQPLDRAGHAAGQRRPSPARARPAGSRSLRRRRSRSRPTRPTSPRTSRRTATTRSTPAYFADRGASQRPADARWPTATDGGNGVYRYGGRRLPDPELQRDQLLGRRRLRPTPRRPRPPGRPRPPTPPHRDGPAPRRPSRRDPPLPATAQPARRPNLQTLVLARARRLDAVRRPGPGHHRRGDGQRIPPGPDLLDVSAGVDLVGTDASLVDGVGHGTHVAGIIAGTGTMRTAAPTGVAPRAHVISVKVTDGAGIATVLEPSSRALEWVVANRQTYNIRVVNLSLGATPRVTYQDDPLAAAAELAWFSGVVVVASAGNARPGRRQRHVPANDPYVITVGAVDQAATAGRQRRRDPGLELARTDRLRQPTRSRTSSPAAEGSSRCARPARSSTWPGPSAWSTANYFRLSGTSMAAPVVSGVAALDAGRQPEPDARIRSSTSSSRPPAMAATTSERAGRRPGRRDGRGRAWPRGATVPARRTRSAPERRLRASRLHPGAGRAGHLARPELPRPDWSTWNWQYGAWDAGDLGQPGLGEIAWERADWTSGHLGEPDRLGERQLGRHRRRRPRRRSPGRRRAGRRRLDDGALDDGALDDGALTAALDDGALVAEAGLRSPGPAASRPRSVIPTVESLPPSTLGPL